MRQVDNIKTIQYLNKLVNLNTKEDVYVIGVSNGIILVNVNKYLELKEEFISSNMKFLENDYTIEREKIEEIFDKEYLINKLEGKENE